MPTENDQLTLAIAAGSALISLVSVGITLAQLRAGVHLARHQATFDHLGRVRKLLRDVSIHDPVSAREAALAFWNHEAAELPPNARAYLDLLDEWDLLGVAFREKRVDRKLVLESLRYTFRDSHNINRGFILQTQKRFLNPRMYADLDYLIQCCLRPTLLERLTAIRRAFYEATSDAPTIDKDAEVESSVSLSPPVAETQAIAPKLGEMPVSDQKPATSPPSSPPPITGPRGETPGFRPPAPPSKSRAEVRDDKTPLVIPEENDR